MAAFSPFRLALAGLVLALGYGWILALFCVGAMLGIVMFVMVPFYIAAVPVIMSRTHELASSVLHAGPGRATVPTRPHATSVQAQSPAPVPS